MSHRAPFIYLIGALVLAAITLPAAGQQQITYSDFSSTAGLVCNGSASSDNCRTSGTALLLTDASGGEAGSAWFVNPNIEGGKLSLANGFTTNFQFRFTGASSPPADGIAFVIQNVGTSALANAGGSIGYGDGTKTEPPPAVPPAANPIGFASLAIEFDTYNNGAANGESYVPHVAVQSCGPTDTNTADHAWNSHACSLGISVAGAVPYLSDGLTHTATINYQVPPNCTASCVPTLSVIVDQTTVLTTNVNIPTKLGLNATGDAFVGFTAATGSLYEEHDILNWNFSVTSTQTTPVSQASPVVTATFNNAPNNLVQHTVDFTAAFLTQTGTEPTNPVMTNSNQAVAPGDWPKFVAGTPFATTACIPHNGEGGNCKLYTDLCTSDENPTPAGINCPQSTTKNIVIQDSFDASPKPTTPPGTGFGFLMGSDNWTTQGATSCVLAGPLAGISCPQDILVSFVGDGSVGTGQTKSLNSTFVSVSGVLMPQTFFTASPTNSNGWVTSATPTLGFAAYPPGVDAPVHGLPIPMVGSLPFNGYVAAPIASIAYNVNGAAIPPAPLNAAPCTLPLGTPAIFTPTPVPVTLIQGANTVQYSATDCAGISELLFSFDPTPQSWSTATKSATVYVDSMKPTWVCPAADTAWHKTNVTVSCTASDNASGFAPATSVIGGTSFGALSEMVPLSTAISGPIETTNAMTGTASVSDLAGNGPVTVGPVTGIKIDTIPPAISIVTHVTGVQNFFLNQVVPATYKCTDNGSGVTKCGSSTFSTPVHATSNISSNVNTAVLGQGQQFSVVANDLAGNSTTVNLYSYNVSYLFIGFLTLQQPPLTNTLKAGKATAILFDVQDGRIKAISGLKLAPTGTVTVSASSSASCKGVNPTPVAFNGTLTGLPFGAYSLNWTPPSSLTGQCVTVSVGLGDGLTHKVNLKF